MMRLTRVCDYVLADEFMSIRTVRLANIYASGSISTATVFGMGHGFKVPWVHAGTVATEMIEFQPFWDCASHKLVSKSVGSDGWTAPRKIEFPIASIRLASSP